MIAAALVLASARTQIGDFLSALLTVYIILIFAHILLSLVLSFGGRIPYSRWSSAVIGFLRDVTEPYLALFRRFIPAIGPVDISPIVAILALQFVGGAIVSLIHG
jgi:YggT family protein